MREEFKLLKKRGKTNKNARYRYVIQNLPEIPQTVQFLRKDGKPGLHECKNFVNKFMYYYDLVPLPNGRYQWIYLPENKPIDECRMEKCPVCGMTPEEMNAEIFPTEEEIEAALKDES
jgi:hypothetical protein